MDPIEIAKMLGAVANTKPCPECLQPMYTLLGDPRLRAMAAPISGQRNLDACPSCNTVYIALQCKGW